MKTKGFYIIKSSLDGVNEGVVEEFISGSLEDTKAALDNEAYADGKYEIAEVVTLVEKKTVTVAPTTKITFEPMRKRPRKAKADVKK